MLDVHPVAAFQDNYIWMLTLDQGATAVAVDPGDAKPVRDWLKSRGLALEAILVTHHHPDHTGGIAELKGERDIPVFGPANSPTTEVNRALDEGSVFELFNHSFSVKRIPGHTLDHIAYRVDSPRGTQVFCGDTLFLAGCGRLFEGSAQQMQEAMDYFAALPEEARLYPAHEYSLANLNFARAVEPDNAAIGQALEDCQALRDQGRPTLPTTLSSELRINPYLRTREPAVVTAARQKEGRQLAPGVETLAAIRHWKDTF